jgi:hypothetical protein
MGLDMATVEERRYEEYEVPEFDMFNTDMNIAKEYDEYVEHEEHDEFNTDRDIFKGHITYKFEQDSKLLWLRGGCNRAKFRTFTQQWSLYKGCHSGMDDRELRQQLLNSIDGPLEDDLYDVLGSKINTISETDILEVLEKLAVEEIITKYVNYSTMASKKNPVKQPPAHRSPAHSSPAHSKSKKIAVKQPQAHSSPAHSKSKKIAVKQPPAKFKPPALAQALATLGLHREDTHGPAAGGGAEKVHLYTIPARRPAPRPGIRRPAQDLAPEDQDKTWHQKTSTDVAQ